MFYVERFNKLIKYYRYGVLLIQIFVVINFLNKYCRGLFNLKFCLKFFKFLIFFCFFLKEYIFQFCCFGNLLKINFIIYIFNVRFGDEICQFDDNMYNKGIVVDFLDFFLLFEMRIMDFLRSSCGYDVKKIFLVCFQFNLFLLSSSNLF